MGTHANRRKVVVRPHRSSAAARPVRDDAGFVTQKDVKMLAVVFGFGSDVAAFLAFAQEQGRKARGK